MAVQYTHLTYEEYKEFEKQLRDYTSKETTHVSTGGFYHKAIRFRICEGLIMEFHGPLVRGGEPE